MAQKHPAFGGPDEVERKKTSELGGPRVSDTTTTMPPRQFRLSAGTKCAIPIGILFIVAFAAPLLIVLFFSFLPDRTFGFTGELSLENYARFFSEGYYKPFFWTFGLAFVATFCCLLIGYPVAYGLARVFGPWAAIITLFFVIPIFVSENLRLFGWLLFLIKGGGVLAGTLKVLTGFETGTLLYAPGTILLGLIYVYLPFTIFPMTLGISMVPKDQIEAASDLGASRLQIMREIELPIAMPGVLIGVLLTFILAVGAIAEAKILGGQSIITIAHAIQHEFTYAQNWPLGSAISVLTILLVGVIVFIVLYRVDLDRLLGGP